MEIGIEPAFVKFIIVYSADGLHFNKMASIDAKGNGGNYNFIQTDLSIGTAFFKLQKEDKDGMISTMAGVILNINCRGKITLNIYPNALPSTCFLNINISNFSGTGKISVYNKFGLLIKTAMVVNGHNILETTNIEQDIYYIKFLTAEGNETFNIILD